MTRNIVTDASAKGAPHPSELAGPIDEWSQAVYRALADWPVARENAWTRWEPGYLLLTITQVEGRPVEPVLIDSAEGEVTVEFGGWETHNPGPFGLWDAEAETIAAHARALAEEWLGGAIRTLVLTDADGKWCGSKILEPGEVEPLKEAALWVRDFNPVQVEVRSVDRGDWERFAVDPEWLISPPV